MVHIIIKLKEFTIGTHFLFSYERWRPSSSSSKSLFPSLQSPFRTLAGDGKDLVTCLVFPLLAAVAFGPRITLLGPRVLLTWMRPITLLTGQFIPTPVRVLNIFVDGINNYLKPYGISHKRIIYQNSLY